MVHHAGQQTRRNVQVTLKVDGTVVETKTMTSLPRRKPRITFDHKFTVAVEPGRPAFVPVSVSLAADQLPEDDTRSIIVPVVAALPVVFIDELGSKERVQDGVYGETYQLRKLLAR